ncbi:MAG: DUF4276 family protein [Chloroflexi bacterium]|nr:DUF4276 family protein [Chloroflexota bacterium]
MSLSYTLLGDGSSDKVLLYVIDWLLKQQSSQIFERNFTYRQELVQGKASLTFVIERALHLYPYTDLLFVHRDAEKIAHDIRKHEILDALKKIKIQPLPAVCVVPVRMTEAWLLFDEDAIRHAAENPNGKMPLSLPSPKEIERLTSPKKSLHNILIQACGKTGRRLEKFDPDKQVHLIAPRIDDFSPLRDLPAFQNLEKDLQEILQEHGWQTIFATIIPLQVLLYYCAVHNVIVAINL